MDHWTGVLLAAALSVSQRASAADAVRPVPPQAREMAEKRRTQNAELKALHANHRAAVTQVRADPALSVAEKQVRIQKLDAEFKSLRRAKREKFKAERMALRKQRRSAPKP